MIKTLKGFINGIANDRKVGKTTTVFLLFFLSLFILAVTQSQFSQASFRIGERAPEDFRAPFSMEDREAYEALVEESLARMEAVYRISPTVQITAKADRKSVV